jgi:hypothetical protein
MIVANTACRRDSGLGRDDVADMDGRLLIVSGSPATQIHIKERVAEASIANSKKGRKTFSGQQFAMSHPHGIFARRAGAEGVNYWIHKDCHPLAQS